LITGVSIHAPFIKYFMKNYRPILSIYLIVISFCCMPWLAFAQAPTIQWEKCIGGTDMEYGYCVKPTHDNGFIVAGTSNSVGFELPANHGSYDAYIVKLSATGAILWQTMVGRAGADYANAILQTEDDGYVMVGSTSSSDSAFAGNHGGFDVLVARLSADGLIEWQTLLGGSGDDYGYDISRTFDSGYIIAGRTASADGNITLNHGGYDYWVVKLSVTGSLQWQRTFGGSSDDNAVSIRQTADSGYIIAGDSYSADGDKSSSRGGEDYWVLKLSPAGDIQWQKTLGGTGSDYAQAVRQTYDGGYIVAGGSNSADGDITAAVGAGDYWVVKLSATGAITWQQSLGSAADDAANAIEVTSDGGYIVAGWVSAGSGDVTGARGQADYWLVKLSAGGTMQWQKCMGSIGNENAYSVSEAATGEYIVAGYSSYGGLDVSLNHGSLDIWVAKLGAVTAVDELAQQGSVTISPNPTSGQLVVWGIDKAHICIYDIAGRLVAEAIDTLTFSLEGLQSGLYFAAIMNMKGEVVKQAKISKI
jgi:hypothetical protein